MAELVNRQEGVPLHRSGEAHLRWGVVPLTPPRGQGDKAVALDGAVVEDQRQPLRPGTQGRAVGLVDPLEKGGGPPRVRADLLREDDPETGRLERLPGDAGRILICADIEELFLGQEGGIAQQEEGSDLTQFGHEMSPGGCYPKINNS